MNSYEKHHTDQVEYPHKNSNGAHHLKHKNNQIKEEGGVIGGGG